MSESLFPGDDLPDATSDASVASDVGGAPDADPADSTDPAAEMTSEITLDQVPEGQQMLPGVAATASTDAGTDADAGGADTDPVVDAGGVGADEVVPDVAATVVAVLPTVPAQPDTMLAAALEAARNAAVAVGGDTVGEHVAVAAEGERLVTHFFESTLPGYRGWQWAVTLVRGPRARTATVDEVVLLPGPGALLAPAWVPWEERIRPGDLSPGELLPSEPDDARLVPAYSGSGDEVLDAVGRELGLGRSRVMSRDGRLDAAHRWYGGDRGPEASMARHAPAPCGTCGFLLPLAGSLQAGFGVCGNELTDTDGQVVSVEFGCGAHSQVVAPVASRQDQAEIVYDDGDIITVER